MNPARAQFKDRTVARTYVAITLGVPRGAKGRVATNVGRDLRDRKKMAAFAYGSLRRARPAGVGGSALRCGCVAGVCAGVGLQAPPEQLVERETQMHPYWAGLAGAGLG